MALPNDEKQIELLTFLILKEHDEFLIQLWTKRIRYLQKRIEREKITETQTLQPNSKRQE